MKKNVKMNTIITALVLLFLAGNAFAEKTVTYKIKDDAAQFGAAFVD
jgi:hypothetical protein